MTTASGQSGGGPGPTTARRVSARGVAALCWSAVALEGYDLVVLGVVLPKLLRDPSWQLTPATASLISSWAWSA